MPSAISFGARTTRENNYVGVSKETIQGDLGPGSYILKDTITPQKPSYAPFGSTSARKFTSNQGRQAIPGPAAYDTVKVEEQRKMAVKEESDPAFKPSGPRFVHKRDDTPGPGHYTVPSTIIPQKSNYVQTYDEQSEEMSWSRMPTAPSIPAANQCYGYEENPATGDLVMQRPMNQGYKGEKGDTAGPLDYKPKLSQTKRNVRSIDFSKGTNRPDITSKLAGLKENSSSPGPGSYNLIDYQSTQANAAVKPVQRRKKNAVFESKVERLKEKRRYETMGPGPASYVLPSTLKVEDRPDHVQCFGTSSSRFLEMHETGAPGPGFYGRPMSDFERRSLEARKQKLRQPNHREAVPFLSSGQRFVSSKNNQFGSAPGSYEFPGTMASEIKKKLTSRVGAFGTTSKRFPNWTEQEQMPQATGGTGGGGSKRSHSQGSSRQSASTKSAAAGGSAGIENYLRLVTQNGGEEEWGGNANNMGSKKPMRGRPHADKLHAVHVGATSGGDSNSNNNSNNNNNNNNNNKTSSFASASKRFEERGKDRDAGPPPGAYDVNLKWRSTSVVPLGSGPAERIPKINRTSGDIGPGEYKIGSSIKVKNNNRKNIMVSTQSRFGVADKKMVDAGPGPGSYNADYFYGNLIQPTFNIAIAESCGFLA